MEKIIGILLNAAMLTSLYFENTKWIGMSYAVLIMVIASSCAIFFLLFGDKMKGRVDFFENPIINIVVPILFFISLLILKEYVFATIFGIVSLLVDLVVLKYNVEKNHE